MNNQNGGKNINKPKKEKNLISVKNLSLKLKEPSKVAYLYIKKSPLQSEGRH